MNFTNSYRIERVYFERLKSMIDILKPYLNEETDEKLKSILENSIDDNGAILLLYRNLGECWAELSDLIKKADEKIDSLDDKTEKYHDELNERIDEVNNYIMAIIREIEARLETVEQDLATLSRNIILDLERVNDAYSLSYKGDPVDFAQLAGWVEFPYNVIVRGVVNGEETVFHLREFDTDSVAGVFEFYVTGLIDNLEHEITITVLPDDSVNVSTDVQRGYTAGTGIGISNWTIDCTVPDLTNEVADLDSRLDNAEDDIDTLEQTAENLEQNKQDKLTAGSGISIDPDTGVIENTAQGSLNPETLIPLNGVGGTVTSAGIAESNGFRYRSRTYNFNISGDENYSLLRGIVHVDQNLINLPFSFPIGIYLEGYFSLHVTDGVSPSTRKLHNNYGIALFRPTTAVNTGRFKTAFSDVMLDFEAVKKKLESMGLTLTSISFTIVPYIYNKDYNNNTAFITADNSDISQICNYFTPAVYSN